MRVPGKAANVDVPKQYQDKCKDANWKAMIDTGKLDEACEGLVKSDCDPSELVDKLQAVLLTKVSVCKPLKEPVAPAMTELNAFIPVYRTLPPGPSVDSRRWQV